MRFVCNYTGLNEDAIENLQSTELSRNIFEYYYENEYGFWLLQNRITAGTFKWPEIGEKVKIDRRQLDWLLKGLDVVEHKPKPQLDVKYY